MAKGALIEQRPWLLASIAAATLYYFLRDNPVGEGLWGIALKGASVGLLAIYVALRVPQGKHRADGFLLVGVLALAAIALPTDRRGQGLAGVAVRICGVDVRPGDWLYADEDGIVVGANALT